jgi:hypothetical protein
MDTKKLVALAAGALLTVGCADSLTPTLPANIEAGGAGFQVLTDTTTAPDASGQETTTTATCAEYGGGAMGSGGKSDETCTDSSAI